MMGSRNEHRNCSPGISSALGIAVGVAGETAFLEMSIELPPLSDDLKKSLRVFGVHTTWQVMSHSRDAISARFGSEGILVWELYNDIARRPVVSVGILV